MLVIFVYHFQAVEPNPFGSSSMGSGGIDGSFLRTSAVDIAEPSTSDDAAESATQLVSRLASHALALARLASHCASASPPARSSAPVAFPEGAARLSRMEEARASASLRMVFAALTPLPLLSLVRALPFSPA